MKKLIIALLIQSAILFAAEKNPFSDIRMITLAQGGASYIIGEGAASSTSVRNIQTFSINKYETTYVLWYKVRTEAEKIGYVFQNPGQEGSLGRRGKSPSAADSAQPVSMISWYDAIVWCNALSELRGLKPCYTYNGKILKDSSASYECDLSECNWKADGYRLPTEAEWEFAARYTKNGMQSGGRGSGDISHEENPEKALEIIAWTSTNAKASMPVGTAGTPFTEEESTEQGSGNSNNAGIFDMSGNMLEFCWDWYSEYKEQPKGTFASGPKLGNQRVSRGGSFSEYTFFAYAGDRYYLDPNEYYDYTGFRIAKSGR